MASPRHTLLDVDPRQDWPVMFFWLVISFTLFLSILPSILGAILRANYEAARREAAARAHLPKDQLQAGFQGDSPLDFYVTRRYRVVPPTGAPSVLTIFVINSAKLKYFSSSVAAADAGNRTAKLASLHTVSFKLDRTAIEAALFDPRHRPGGPQRVRQVRQVRHVPVTANVMIDQHNAAGRPAPNDDYDDYEGDSGEASDYYYYDFDLVVAANHEVRRLQQRNSPENDRANNHDSEHKNNNNNNNNNHSSGSWAHRSHRWRALQKPNASSHQEQGKLVGQHAPRRASFADDPFFIEYRPAPLGDGRALP